MKRKFWESSPEEKEKALNKAWKWYLGEDDVIRIGKNTPMYWRRFIWLEYEIRVTEDDVKAFLVSKLRG